MKREIQKERVGERKESGGVVRDNKFWGGARECVP
jgi:hypothetical protein